jgi:hypothetical protein
MASCYWAQPAQLHPWYKLDTLKRKLPPILPRSSSPSSMDEYDSDPRAKRQRRTTPEQTRSTKRKLQSPPQSPIESSESSDSSRPNDPRLFKRQRCTTLEREIESLSLTAIPSPTQGQTQALAPSALASISTPLTQVTPRLSTPVSPPLAAPLVSAVHVHRQHEHHVHPDFANSRWPNMSYSSSTTTTPNSRPISSPPPPFSTSTSISSAFVPTLTVDTDAITDVKMHTSSWYEPEKDSTCPFSLAIFFFLVGFAQSRSLTVRYAPPPPSPHP